MPHSAPVMASMNSGTSSGMRPVTVGAPGVDGTVASTLSPALAHVLGRRPDATPEQATASSPDIVSRARMPHATRGAPRRAPRVTAVALISHLFLEFLVEPHEVVGRVMKPIAFLTPVIL